MENHNSISAGKTGIQYCTRCGHVHLHNEVSRLITRLGCDYEESKNIVIGLNGIGLQYIKGDFLNEDYQTIFLS